MQSFQPPTLETPPDVLGLNTREARELRHSLEQGLSPDSWPTPETVGRLAQTLGLTLTDLLALLGVSRSTFDRRKARGKLELPEVDTLLAYADLYLLAREVFEDDIRARDWLSSPKRLLEGKSPLEVARTRTGLLRVRELVLRLEHSLYS